MRTTSVLARCAAVALGLVLAWPESLEAHARLKSSAPANGARLSAVPRELRFDFTESPALGFTSVLLRDSAGAVVRLGKIRYATDSRRAIVIPVSGLSHAGPYTVEWQVAGDDGHPIRGSFSFVVAPGATGLGAAPVNTAADDSAMAAMHHDPATMPSGYGFDVESPIYVAIRWIQFVALLILVGALAFAQIVLPLMSRRSPMYAELIGHAKRRAARVGAAAAVLLLFAAASRLFAQAVAMHGSPSAWDFAELRPMLFDTAWGYAWIAQFVLGVAVLVALRSVAGGSGARRAAWAVAAIAVVALVFTPAFAGHAAATPEKAGLAILADGLHIAGAGGWLGSLLLVIAVGIPAALSLGDDSRGAAVADLFNAFSPTGLVFAGLVGLTGLFAGWIHLGSVSALWQSSYGKTLLIKLAILSVVALTGAYNWLRVKPTLDQAEGAIRIRRSATVEVIVGALVLLVTAVLVAMPTAKDMKM